MSRFVDSLSAKVHSSPPTIEKISLLFQDFYSRAESHIATHISALSSRINREPSPNPPPRTPRASIQQKLSNRSAQNDPEKAFSGRQMLTASEVEEKRKARKFLSRKRAALEETVERRACEGIYDKIFQHRSTLDEVRDEKLRSKTAALLLVGINLKDLGIDIDIESIDEEKQKDANDDMSIARECLMKMNDAKYPLGKLQHLAAAHRSIVDALTKLLPSSSSADELLPALIYSLVTCPPEGINAISNLLFIQRFRSSSKIYGETAYCLTNFEAAISFLENVDLSELRPEEGQDGQSRLPGDTSLPSTEKLDPFPLVKEMPAPSITPVSATPELLKPGDNERASATLPRARPSSSQQRRLSNLFQPPSKVLGAANDAVRNTADQSLKNIGATLDNSFNFFFGRLRELQSNQLPVTEGGIPILPKTLAEARRLVAAQSALGGQKPGQENNASNETVDRLPRDATSKAQDTIKDIMSGRGTPRDRSSDSARTQNSSKQPATGPISMKDEETGVPGASQPSPMAPSTPTPLESMKYLGNSLNPLNHIPGMIRGFGRPAGPTSPAPTGRPKPSPTPAEGSLTPPGSASKIDPPIQRFLEMDNTDNLTLKDVSVLLEDYKRLATALSKQYGGPS